MCSLKYNQRFRRTAKMGPRYLPTIWKLTVQSKSQNCSALASLIDLDGSPLDLPQHVVE